MMNKTGIFLITGFSQDYLKPAGLEMQQRVLEHHAIRHEDVEVFEHLLWKDDMARIAEYAKRDGVTNAIIAGYSYGGGYGAQRLSGQLLKRGVDVDLQILCDPVHRVSWLPKWKIFVPLTFRSITPWATVKVPAKVKRVIGIRQERTIPKAHPIKWRGHKWELPLVTDKEITHLTIDESFEWQELLYSAVAKEVEI